MEDLSKQLHDILDKFGKDMVHDLKESVNKYHKPPNGNDTSLAGSIKFEVYGQGLERGVHFTMADYWEYAENGSRPSKYQGNKHSKAKIDSLMNWIKERRSIFADYLVRSKKDQAKIDSFKKRRGRAGGSFLKVRKTFKEVSFDKRVRSLAFAIATSIAKKGTIERFQYKGSKFASKVLLDGRITKLEEEIAEKIGLQIVVDITEALKPKVKV